MKGLRILERFGFNLPPGSKKDAIGARVVQEVEEWIYSPKFHDWLHAHNELTLSGYYPSEELVRLLEGNVDLELE